MKRLVGAMLVGFLLGGTVAEGTQGNGKKKGQAEAAKYDKSGKPESHVSLHLVFGRADVVILRDYYGPRYRELPPGFRRRSRAGVSFLPDGARSSKASLPKSIAGWRRSRRATAAA